MLRADRIDKDYWRLEVGERFTYKTTRKIDEYIVVGFKQEYSGEYMTRIPLAVPLFPKHLLTTVHEVRNIV